MNSPAELVLWFVYKYCAENIRAYLPAQVTSNKITGTLDLDGYSYYPVTVVNTDVDITNAKIIFHNQEIESKESGNKSTLASGSATRTQHFAMHSGLLYNYSTDSNGKDIAVLTVQNTTLLGTVGMVEDGSGALICGAIRRGDDSNQLVKLEINNLDLDLDGESPLQIDKFAKAYAPLLINRVGSYTTLEITGVTAKAAKTPSATSLIGKVDGTYMNLSFSRMELADMEGSRFTLATMLHSFHFQEETNSAVYNFAKEEDWENDTHVHHVTYSKEIGGTSEYINSSNPKQEWYFGIREYVSYTGTGFVSSTPDSFEGYLPYVYTSYNAGEKFHEIQVNGSMTDVSAGCGTYGDPYQISSAEELQSIAAYLALGTPSKGWKLNLPASETTGESSFCPSQPKASTHTLYEYNGSHWVSQSDPQTTLPNTSVRRYLSNAYYQITDNLTVSSFMGIGTLDYPFRGVIVGDGKTTITLNGTLPKGFLVASYGSVVKGLNLTFNGSSTMEFASIRSDYTTEAYFGGVIGNVLGGDNIIQDVKVTYSEGGNHIVLGNTKPYLVPVGGYVGLIQGGGVIFRGSNTLTGIPNEFANNQDAYYYVNPYVGRVLQGFAVNEGTTQLDNTEKNYQICSIDKENVNGIQLSGASITLSDAQALLIFTSVTNSGGAGNGALRSYLSTAQTYWSSGTFGEGAAMGGKVRNATYENVGNLTKANNSDYQQSLKDDFSAFRSGNTSYLDTHYAGGTLYNVCGTTAYSLTFSGSTYDMSVYGNGYRSISPRYLSTAVCTKDGTVSYKELLRGESACCRILPLPIFDKQHVSLLCRRNRWQH